MRTTIGLILAVGLLPVILVLNLHPELADLSHRGAVILGLLVVQASGAGLCAWAYYKP